MVWQIRSTSSIALGNGTRPVGFLFGTLVDEDSYALAVDAASNADMESVKSLVEIAEGVELDEVVNALRTQLFGGPIQVVDPAAVNQTKNAEQEIGEIKTEDLGLSAGVQAALLGAHLLTVAQIIEFAERNDGLQSLEGIGEAAEKKIKAAINAALAN